MRHLMVRPAELREMDVILPAGVLEDIYKVHQYIWRAIRDHSTTPQPLFLFRVSQGIARVRSRDIGGPYTQLKSCPTQSDTLFELGVDLKAAHTVDGKETGIPASQIDEWAIRVLQHNGFKVYEGSVRVEQLRGEKNDHGRKHDIRFRVARIRARASIIDQSAAKAAWLNGIGRGKRFGMGMPTLI